MDVKRSRLRTAGRARAGAVCALALLLGFASSEVVAAPATPVSAQAGLIEDVQYAGDEAARAAWRPMGATAPVSVVSLAGRRALRMPCNFVGARLERASWDRQVAVDLSACRGLEFKLLCRNASPVSYFSCYLQSGAGWYHATFYPESSNDWNAITLDKAAFGTEGQPAGWGKVRAIRISAWCGQEKDTEFFLSDLRPTGVLGVDAPVAILRAESVAASRPEEARSVTQYTETMSEMLQALGIGCAVLSDLDLTVERLKPARVVILPHNPQIPDRAAEALTTHVRRGGKLLLFYVVPERLRGLLAVGGERHVRESRPGAFAAIGPLEGALPGAPSRIGQRSWNISSFQPVGGSGKVLAEWLDDQGRPSGHAAVLGSTNGLVMTHVLLPDDPPNKRRLLLAMLGRLAPELWQQAIQASLDRIGAVGPARDFSQAVALLQAPTTNPGAVLDKLQAARSARQSAQERAKAGRFAEALDQVALAQERLLEAYCLAQASLPGEFRAFWCHSAFGVQGLSWDEAIRRLATNGFTAILPNMLWGGVAYYPSKVLPVAPEVAKRGDQIAQCLAAARQYGLQVHVWKVNWNLAHNAPRSFVEELRRAGRLQADANGREEPWLCPSHPDNQKLEIESMLEVARNYPVDGLHFDYIRYPDSDHCYCAGCRGRFQRAGGLTVKDWPRSVRLGGALHQQWLEWRRENITAVVRSTSEQARSLRPGVKISAAVFRNWPTDRDGVGQDWKLWCERGWLDFVCPMDYTSSARQFENMVARQIGWAGRTPCYPGIGESASSSRLGADAVIEQILITRRHRTGGFVIFNYGVAEAQELLPRLGLGITRPDP